MTMQDDYLLQYALAKTWCSPRQDNQWVYAPKRISPNFGWIGQARLNGRLVKLPDSTRYYHVFQMAQIDPAFLNLIRQEPLWFGEKWYKCSEAMNASNMEITVYNGNGVNLPRTDSYYMFTDDRCLFFVVPTNKKFAVDYQKEQIYFRFYTNPYVETNTGKEQLKVRVGSYKPTSNNEILQIEAAIAELKKKPGLVRCYINGMFADNFNLGNVKINDYLEYVYDGSVKKVLTWRMSDLFNFKSELDQNVYKYLLHYSGDNDWYIDFQDDLDIHVVYSVPGQYRRGLYYNRNFEKNHRMVTHKDYAIDAEVSALLRDSLAGLLNLPSIPTSDTYVELLVRHNPTNPRIRFENNRIRELYKLPDQKLYEAMIGVNALVPEWYCVNLEKSASIEMMRRDWEKFDIALIENGYGYNAISKIVADTPMKLQNTGSEWATPLPPGLQNGSTVYEFDENGLLLEWHVHVNGTSYQAHNPNARLIEAVMGQGGKTSNSLYGQDNIPVSPNWEYRVYRCNLQDGVPDNNWEDITGSSAYRVENGMVKWNFNSNYHWLCVRADDHFVAYDIEHEFNSGTLNFTVTEVQTGDPLDEMEPIAIPFAQLDIWMNQYKLIRGLDYFVKWPRVYITNKTYLLKGTLGVKQKFHIRASRLDEGLKGLDAIDEFGWVFHGSLSNNDIYDVREDRVMQITLGGAIRHREDLVFSEDKPGPAIIHQYNGFPYQLKDLVVPFNAFTDRSPYILRKSSQVIDKAVSEYLTQHYDDTIPDGVSSIGPRYPVVSPFLSYILYLLANQAMPIPQDRRLGDLEVRQYCRDHEWMLEFDPLSKEHQPDIRYAFTVPHPSEDIYILEFAEYHFFTRVVAIYGYPGLVTKGYVAIKSY